jgi:oligopeptide/dipeptide ABC transporter ATP-binding protein
MTPVLRIEDLTVCYPATVRPAVDHLSLEVHEGELVCVVGESGSGKSTLALACLRLLGEDVRVSGVVELAGKRILELSKSELRAVRGRDVGFVYQDALSSFSPLWTVGEQIAETVRAHESCSRRDAWARVIEQLATVRLRDPERIATSYPHELSGGQRQRAAFAMALVLSPRLLIADEPTSALDVTTSAHVLALLKQLQRELRISVVLITHDMHVVDAVADRIAVMYAGLIGEVGRAAEVRTRPRFPYTRALIESLELDRPRGGLRVIPGAPPGLSVPLAGCPFAPRCPNAQQHCAEVVPGPTEIGGSLVRCHFPHTYTEAEVHVTAGR